MITQVTTTDGKTALRMLKSKDSRFAIHEFQQKLRLFEKNEHELTVCGS